jgi:hypothetical protein
MHALQHQCFGLINVLPPFSLCFQMQSFHNKLCGPELKQFESEYGYGQMKDEVMKGEKI